MKNRIIIALALISAAACTRMEKLQETFLPEYNGVPMTFSASFDEKNTRTVLQSDGSVFWNPGDSIVVFPLSDTVSAGCCFTTDITKPSLYASFSGICTTAPRYLALYPYLKDASVTRGVVRITVPAVQNAVAGSFDPKAFPSVALTDTSVLYFRNVCGGAKMKFTRSDITSVEFRARGGEALCGSVSASMVSGMPYIKTLSTKSSVTLLGPDGGCFDKGVVYCISLLPISLDSGFDIVYHTANSSAVYEYGDTVTIHRSVFGRLYDLDKNLKFSQPDTSDYFCFTALESDVKISMADSFHFGIKKYLDLMYSKDRIVWNNFIVKHSDDSESDSTVITLSTPGDKAYIKAGLAGNTSIAINDAHFLVSGKVSVSGNIMYLLKGEAPAENFTDDNIKAFSKVFLDVRALTDASALKLPATILADYCYSEMFFGCTSLAKAPELPATSLADGCYSGMFSGCESITNAPRLPATILANYCYSGMFNGCKSLAKAPELPATSLTNGCYNSMFRGCKSLTYAPELTATILKVRCYEYMFSGCESITNAPRLPATILADDCYCGMFSGCTSLAKAPELPATILKDWCYADMFRGCKNLQYIKMDATDISATYCLDNWVNGVSSTGTFVKNANATWNVRGYNGIPTGWNVIMPETSVMSGANCFIVSEYGKAAFNCTKKGNSEESVGTISSAEVLWESFGTGVTPNVGDVISSVSYDSSKGIVNFMANADGNAVIAVKDASGNILWSWHIWVCKGFDAEKTAQVYNNNAGTMMDRNLGATTSTPGGINSFGLLYQWGRKDPFLSGYSISSTDEAASTLNWPASVKSDMSYGTIAYAVSHPTTFITSCSNGDWYYTAGTYISPDNTRWQPSGTTKGLYDPCPKGWRIPDGGAKGVWSTAFGSTSYIDDVPWVNADKGMNFGSGNGKDDSAQLGESPVIWYPVAGCRECSYGLMINFKSNGYWSCTIDEGYSYIAYILDIEQTAVYPDFYTKSKAYGYSVRCMKD